MNYLRIYENIIERAKNRILTSYKEKHHIIPKCMLGANDKSNLISLTAKEHFICHRLLVLIYPNNSKLKFALWAMSVMKDKNNKQNKRYKISARVYQILKEEHSKEFSKARKGHEVSEETKQKISTTLTGFKQSKETKEKMSKTAKGKNIWSKGRKLSKETKEKMSGRKGKLNPSYGKKHSDESKSKMSKSLKGRKVWNKGLNSINCESIKLQAEKKKGKPITKLWKPVYQYDLEGVLVKTWPSFTSVLEAGYSEYKLKKNIDKLTNEYNGFKWSYEK